MWPWARKREIDVYDRRLEAISAAAELGSFSRAAAKLRVSTPALVKQVSGFEAEFGITLFERSHSGVKVTPAGALLVDDARSIMRQSEDALRRARRAAGDGGAVRLGVSMMCPGRQTLSMWTGVHELEPSLRFEIVPVSDLYDERESVMRSLGREVDVVQSSFSTPRWGDVCQKLRIVNVPFYIDVPRTSPLARMVRGAPGLCGRAVPVRARGAGLSALPARAHPPSPKIRQRHGPTPQVAKRVPSQISYPLLRV